MGKQVKIWDKEFQNFLSKKEQFSVIRILTNSEITKKDELKSRNFEKLEEAVKYYFTIKDDFVEGYEVITSVFNGTKILKKYSKIKICYVASQTKLKL